MKFDWVLLKVIHLDVNSESILNRFPCSFVGNIGCYYGNFPVNLAKLDYCKLCEVWFITAKIIKEIGVKFDRVLLKVIHLNVNSDVTSQPFSM